MVSDKANKDGNGNIITETYETKTDAQNKLTQAKQYADKCIQTASLITFDSKYKLLDKAIDASEEDYNFNYGFGTYEFYDKKYENFFLWRICAGGGGSRCRLCLCFA